MKEETRYDRQIIFLGEEGQKKIEQTKVGIVGLGGIGGQVAQSLAYLGAVQFVLIDDDAVNLTNLNRLVGAYPEDAKEGRPKTAVAARMIQNINPNTVIQEIPKNLRTKEAIGALIGVDTIFGCVDHDGPRLVLTELAASYSIVLIDLASEIFHENGKIVDFSGRIIVCKPGDYCLDCANQIDMERAKQELESKNTQAVREAHGYGLGEQAPSPSVISLNGVIANLGTTEFMFMVTGLEKPVKHSTYYGLRRRINIREDGRRPDCYICGYLAGKREKANIYRYVVNE